MKLSYFFGLILWIVLGQSCQHNPGSAPAESTAVVNLDSLRILGAEVANTSQKALLAQVTQSLSTQGPIGTISFCHESVAGLMDSLSRAAGYSIQRISDRPRNPANRANDRELALIDHFKQQKTPADTLLSEGDGPTYYKPILLGLEACLQCHGTPQAQGGIQAATLEKLSTLYPLDEARNYQLGEVRGAWKIRFKSPSAQ